MRIAVNGARLWFDVEGPSLVPGGPDMRERPTLVLLHGGPGSYDHSYFKPHLAPLSAVAQLVYLDLRDHGRSSRGDPDDWSFERCADDIRAFCDALAIRRPVVLGHSMGGFVAMLYGARHPGHAAGLVLAATMARFDLDRLVDGIRRNGGDDVALLARRDYAGDEVDDEAWERVFAAFGPHVPDGDTLARRVRNPAVHERGMELMRGLDLVDQLARIDVPTLVVVGGLDGVTPVACSEEIVAGLRPGIGRLTVLDDAGHFAWLDAPDRFVETIGAFVRSLC